MKRRKKTKAENVENGEATGKKKKGGKKKLLLIPIALVLVAAIAAVVVMFVLPRFGINLIGGGDDSEQLEEPLPKKGVEAYTGYDSGGGRWGIAGHAQSGKGRGRCGHQIYLHL